MGGLPHIGHLKEVADGRKVGRWESAKVCDFRPPFLLSLAKDRPPLIWNLENQMAIMSAP
jgi:hypothetical protein